MHCLAGKLFGPLSRQALRPTSHSNSLLNLPAGHKHCTRCFQSKPFDQFLKKKQTATETTENENRKPLLQTCATCRTGLKSRDQQKALKRREAMDQEKEASFECHTWEDIVAKIENGYFGT
jgi:hypothetical protein